MPPLVPSPSIAPTSSNMTGPRRFVVHDLGYVSIPQSLLTLEDLQAKDYEELAATVMTIVDCVVNKTWEKIESSTDVLKGILRPVVVGVEEISWPPRDPEAINEMEKACTHMFTFL
ncbi:hypothetical protein Bca52824_089690 [Brassica carinata]|uniref:Uncharacterized protein n=1 Tax=Brassica carinata TaxID=52824 RepID=A0A8X7PG69_BRACI|nr:hypothetical protein Bca52824_089690 [Brassica carinata]